MSRKAHGTPAEIWDKSGSHAQVPPAEAATIPKEREEHGGESNSEGEKSSLVELIANDPAVARSDGRRRAHDLVFTASDLSKRSPHFLSFTFPCIDSLSSCLFSYCSTSLGLLIFFVKAEHDSAPRHRHA